MADLRKVSPNQPVKIAAETWNAFIDAANVTRAEAASGRTPNRASECAPIIIRVKNASTTDDVERFRILQINAPLPLPADNQLEFQNNLVMSADKPSGDYVGGWCVLLDSIPKGQIGRAIVAGITPARVNIDQIKDRFANTQSGNVVLKSGADGAPIIWVAGGVGSATATGEQWAVINLQPQTREVIPVTLSAGSGADGSGSSAPSYTYLCTDFNGDEITKGTAISPQGNRPNGKTVRAGIGVVVRNSGTLKLWWCDEKPNTGSCP